MVLGRVPRWTYYTQRGKRTLSRVSRAGHAGFRAFPALDLLYTARDLEAPVRSARASPLRFPRGMRGEARFPRGKRGKTRVRGAEKVRFPRGIRHINLLYHRQRSPTCNPARGTRFLPASELASGLAGSVGRST